MTYTFTDHLHNYAVWTAARAVLRNFTDTKNIKSAIEKTDLKCMPRHHLHIYQDFQTQLLNKHIMI